MGEQPAKRNTRNQKRFEKLIIMNYGEIKLTVALIFHTFRPFFAVFSI